MSGGMWDYLSNRLEDRAEDVMTLADIPLCQACGEHLMLIAHDNLFVWQPDYMREETSQP